MELSVNLATPLETMMLAGVGELGCSGSGGWRGRVAGQAVCGAEIQEERRGRERSGPPAPQRPVENRTRVLGKVRSAWEALSLRCLVNVCEGGVSHSDAQTRGSQEKEPQPVAGGGDGQQLPPLPACLRPEPLLLPMQESGRAAPGTATGPHPGDTGPRVQTPGGPWPLGRKLQGRNPLKRTCPKQASVPRPEYSKSLGLASSLLPF